MNPLLLILIAGLYTVSPITKASNPNILFALSKYPKQILKKQNVFTHVRCWYRKANTNDNPRTKWKWAKRKNGNYFIVKGYWKSSVRLKNMFYTNTPAKTIQQRCEETLQLTHDNTDITYSAADHALSYNHTIWSNEQPNQENRINKIVSFGDSLSDTGNMFNMSQWKFPNKRSWFLGNFSNGFVWTQYLAKDLDIPLYTWALGGAAGNKQKLFISGIYQQVTSFLKYMKKAKNYQTKNTLFTLEFGLNDFVNYNRSLGDVKGDYSSALIRLIESGAKHIILLTLPDATLAPQFKYSTKSEAQKVYKKIIGMNNFIRDQAEYYLSRDINIILYDTYEILGDIIQTPEKYGFINASEPCLDLQRNSAADYLHKHALSSACKNSGSDRFLFWDVSHPTTAAHKFFAEQILKSALNQLPL